VSVPSASSAPTGADQARPARSSPGALLVVEGLTRYFGALSALNAVSLSVGRHERRAMIGPNGAGKTTLFNIITGQLAPSAGTIVFEGASIAGLPPHGIARRGIARSFQRTNVFPKLTVLENLRLGAAGDGRGSYDLLGSVTRLAVPLVRAREVAEAVGLSDRLGDAAGRLSYGEQRQLEIGIALATTPKLLLLDEPTAGMSPEETVRMTRMLETVPRDVTLLIIEHDMDVVSTLADRVTVLHHGEVLSEGSFEEVKADPQVYEVYLGHA
jgi:branched-chain amino acid transport system ATP-binding protein